MIIKGIIMYQNLDWNLFREVRRQSAAVGSGK
jgi:hypothetical protein